jgi:hypothetical protein
MPSGDNNFGITNSPKNSLDLTVGRGNLDNKTVVSPQKFGQISAPVKNSLDHIDAPTNDVDVMPQYVNDNSESINTSIRSLRIRQDSMDESQPVQPKSDEPKPEPPKPLRNRKVFVKTSSGAFLGGMGGVAGVGIAAVSSGTFAAKLAIVGGIVGTAFFPGAGTVAGAVIGGVIGAVLGGVFGAGAGASLVKAGGGFRHLMKGPEAEPPQFAKPEDIDNRVDHNQALRQIKDEYAVDAPWFKQLAWDAKASRKAMKANGAQIDQKFGEIIDKFAERAKFPLGVDDVAGPPLPTRDFADAAMTGLIKIYAAPTDYDFDVQESVSSEPEPFRGQLADRFSAFLENNPNASPDTIAAVADAYVQLFTSGYLINQSQYEAIKAFDDALSGVMAGQQNRDSTPITREHIMAMAASAVTSARALNSILNPLAIGFLADDAMPIDPNADRVAETWRSIARPLIQQGKQIHGELFAAITDPLEKLYRTEDLRPSTERIFEEFLTGLVAESDEIDTDSVDVVRRGLGRLDARWAKSDENLEIAQDRFVQWAENELNDGQTISDDDVIRFQTENFKSSMKKEVKTQQN